MKVYCSPEHIKLEEPNYRNYDREAEEKKEEAYKAAIKAWMLEEGYNGPHTGGIARFGVGDGYAQYMLADKGRGSFMIHLAIGDAWKFPFIERLTKADIVKNIEQQNAMTRLFARR